LNFGYSGDIQITAFAFNMGSETAWALGTFRISKIPIASKEARETNYWLRLLLDSEIVDKIGD
jgi:hypothetical protein